MSPCVVEPISDRNTPLNTNNWFSIVLYCLQCTKTSTKGARSWGHLSGSDGAVGDRTSRKNWLKEMHVIKAVEMICIFLVTNYHAQVSYFVLNQSSLSCKARNGLGL